MLFLVACNNESYRYDNTILIYMCGSDLESNFSSASLNINEILKNETDEKNNIIIEAGGAKAWRHHNINSNKLSRFEVSNHELKLIEELDNSSMGSSETFTDFLSFGLENYGAKNMGVIIWNHGDGINGISYDENYNYDGLTINELRDSFNSVSCLIPEGFNLIGFDACLMANYETINAISDYTKYIIASEIREPIGGWNYHRLMESFGSFDGYKNLLNDYASDCSSSNLNYSLSLIDTNKFKVVRNNFNDFALNLLTMDLNIISKKASLLTDLGESFYVEDDKNLIDLGSFAKSLYFNDLANSLQEAIYTASSYDDLSGLSLYYPKRYNEKEIKEYLRIYNNESYKSFISKSFTKAKDLIEFINPGSITNNSFSFSLSKASLKYVKNISYKLFLKDGSAYSCLGYDNDILDLEDGNFSLSLSGRWVILNGKPLSLQIAYSDDEIVYFDTPAKKNDINGFIRFSYNSLTKEIKLMGFISKLARITKLIEGDLITILYDDDKYYGGSSLVLGDSFTFNNNLVPEVANLESGSYASYIVVTDIFGNEYYSDTVKFNILNNDLTITEIDKAFNQLH